MKDGVLYLLLGGVVFMGLVFALVNQSDQNLIDGGLDVVGNITATGNIYFNATREYNIFVADYKLPGINPPEDTLIGYTDVLAFDHAQIEEAFALEHVVTEYKSNSDWQITFYWSPSDTSTGTVRWCVEALVITPKNNELINANGKAYCVTDNATETANELLETTNIKVNGSNSAVDDIVAFRVYRNATDTLDTYEADAYLVLLSVHYTANKMGE